MPFEDVAPPERVRIFFGNQGGNDGFTHGPDTICIDVGDWVRQKWGAIPVAVWLAIESRGDGQRLRPWVAAGPCGVLELARKHLRKDLSERLSSLACPCGRADRDRGEAP